MPISGLPLPREAIQILKDTFEPPDLILRFADVLLKFCHHFRRIGSMR